MRAEIISVGRIETLTLTIIWERAVSGLFVLSCASRLSLWSAAAAAAAATQVNHYLSSLSLSLSMICGAGAAAAAALRSPKMDANRSDALNLVRAKSRRSSGRALRGRSRDTCH